MWVIATIVLVASIITRLPPHTWPRRIALLLPTLWLIVSWIDNNMDVANSESALQVVALAVTLIALPFVGWFLITAINTDFAELPRTHKTAVVGTTALFLVVGFIFGARNDALLTCEDFKVSGNDQPQNCTPASSQ